MSLVEFTTEVRTCLLLAFALSNRETRGEYLELSAVLRRKYESIQRTDEHIRLLREANYRNRLVQIRWYADYWITGHEAALDITYHYAYSSPETRPMKLEQEDLGTILNYLSIELTKASAYAQD